MSERTAHLPRGLGAAPPWNSSGGGRARVRDGDPRTVLVIRSRAGRVSKTATPCDACRMRGLARRADPWPRARVPLGIEGREATVRGKGVPTLRRQELDSPASRGAFGSWAVSMPIVSTLQGGGILPPRAARGVFGACRGHDNGPSTRRSTGRAVLRRSKPLEPAPWTAAPGKTGRPAHLCRGRVVSRLATARTPPLSARLPMWSRDGL